MKSREIASSPSTYLDFAVVGCSVVQGAVDVVRRYPWLPWLFPPLYIAITEALALVCWGLAWCLATTSLPIADPAVLLCLCLLTAAWTLPQYRWVHISNGQLLLFAVHLVLFLQYNAAWALHRWNGHLGLWCIAVPNLALSGYCLAIVAGERCREKARRNVWSLYVLIAPCLLVPQACILWTIAGGR